MMSYACDSLTTYPMCKFGMRFVVRPRTFSRRHTHRGSSPRCGSAVRMCLEELLDDRTDLRRRFFGDEVTAGGEGVHLCLGELATPSLEVPHAERRILHAPEQEHRLLTQSAALRPQPIVPRAGVKERTRASPCTHPLVRRR